MDQRKLLAGWEPTSPGGRALVYQKVSDMYVINSSGRARALKVGQLSD